MTTKMPFRSVFAFPVICVLAGLGALAAAGSAAAAEDAPPERIELTCTEQPLRHVVFGDAGAVSYEELPPREEEPVPVSVIRTGDDDAEPQAVNTARFESPKAYLTSRQAIWTAGQQVDADAGRLRLDLRNYVLTLAETQTPGEATFRRFQCETR